MARAAVRLEKWGRAKHSAGPRQVDRHPTHKKQSPAGRVGRSHTCALTFDWKRTKRWMRRGSARWGFLEEGVREKRWHRDIAVSVPSEHWEVGGQ